MSEQQERTVAEPAEAHGCGAHQLEGGVSPGPSSWGPTSFRKRRLKDLTLKRQRLRLTDPIARDGTCQEKFFVSLASVRTRTASVRLAKL